MPSSPPATLPPLDEEGADDETLNDDDVGGLIAPIDELPLADDDDLLTDPDFGIEPPSDPFSADRDTPIEIDIGSGFGIDANESAPDADDSAGLEQPFGNGLDDDPEDALPPDAEERDGIEGEQALVDGSELPDIDADEQGTEDDERRFGLLVAADETQLGWAPRPWKLNRLSPQRERCGALALADASVVAGSSDLLWLDRGRATPVRIALEGTRITSLALVGRERNVALCVTAFGRLFRRSRFGSDSERLHDWRRALESSAAEAQGLELRQLGSDEPSAVLARLSSGHLIRSDDEGQSFRSVAPPLRASVLSPAGTPICALIAGGAKLGLSFDGGQTWEAHELPSPAREVAAGDAPFLCGSGSTLAIGDIERGLVFSNDGGQSFTAARGTAGVTACTAGRCAGTPAVWAAVYREAGDLTELVQIDATTGEGSIIARVELSDDHDPEHSFEASRLERLLWDGEQLYAVGGAGFWVFAPPRSDPEPGRA
jgi:hypothetical protein